MFLIWFWYVILDKNFFIDCIIYYNVELILFSGIYRVKFLVKGYVNVFCEMVIDGGGWMVNDF